MNRKLFSIGYNGYSIDAFIDALLRSGVECVMDVREIPISRKAGFSKSGLSKHLEAAGISYEHFSVLGSPRELRHEVRQSGDYETFFAAVRRYLRQHDPQEAIRSVIRSARNQFVYHVLLSRLAPLPPEMRYRDDYKPNVLLN